MIRVAVVGCGAIAQKAHLPAVLASASADLVALVDENIVVARSLAKRFAVPRATDNLEAVLSEVDAVILATPPHVRPQLAKLALEMGKHLLCEKPLANSAAACEAIIAAAQEADRIVAVAHSYRFFPNRRKALQLLKEGDLGGVQRVIVEEGNASGWQTRTGYSMRHELVPGGVLLINGIHTLDTLLWWFGELAVVDYRDDAIGGLESNVRLELAAEDGMAITLRLSRTCSLSNRLRVIGERAQVELSLHSNELWYTPHRGQCQSLPLPRVDMQEVWTTQFRDFADSMTTGRPPLAQGHDALRVARVIDACYQAKRARPLPARAPIPGVAW